MKYIEDYHIQANGVLLIVAEIDELYVNDAFLQDDGFINLSEAKVAAINGLDAYTIPKLKDRFSYQRPKEIGTVI